MSDTMELGGVDGDAEATDKGSLADPIFAAFAAQDLFGNCARKRGGMSMVAIVRQKKIGANMNTGMSTLNRVWQRSMGKRMI